MVRVISKHHGVVAGVGFMTDLLTIDLEDWYQVFYGEKMIDPAKWTAYEPRIEIMVDTILIMLDELRLSATFFVIGWLALHHASAIRKIAGRGHEIASHGYWHKPYFDLTPEQIGVDITEAKKVLEDIVGVRVNGFRAPGFSIGASNASALDLVAQAGHTYDSSVLGCKEPVFEIRPGLVEVAPTSLTVLGRHLPSGGGFFFRALPLFLFNFYVTYLRGRRPLNFYIHSWELYADCPRIKMGGVKEFVQYFNVTYTAGKFTAFARSRSFLPIAKFLEQRVKI